jgi:hypothetical protein
MRLDPHHVPPTLTGSGLTLLRLLAALSLGAASVSAQAALHDRGGGMIYDDELDITWLQDWYQSGTAMNWNTAVAWAGDLVHGGFDDWRLPALIDTGNPGCDPSYAGGTDCGYNVLTKSGDTVFSEIAHLWYVTLGNRGRCDPAASTTNSCVVQPGWGLAYTGPFTNMQHAVSYYWFGQQYSPGPLGAWYFTVNDGRQGIEEQSYPRYAVAVRPGDVSAIPEPPAGVLMMLGLGAGLVRRRSRAP